jgi:hypothetical protein
MRPKTGKSPVILAHCLCPSARASIFTIQRPSCWDSLEYADTVIRVYYNIKPQFNIHSTSAQPPPSHDAMSPFVNKNLQAYTTLCQATDTPTLINLDPKAMLNNTDIDMSTTSDLGREWTTTRHSSPPPHHMAKVNTNATTGGLVYLSIRTKRPLDKYTNSTVKKFEIHYSHPTATSNTYLFLGLHVHMKRVVTNRQ